MQKRATLTLATNQNKHYPNAGIRFTGIGNLMHRDVITCCMQAILLCFLLVVGIPNVNAQNLEWALKMGGANIDEGRGVATDANGNVYVTGVFRASASFGSGTNTVTLTSAGSSDGFVAKYDAGGTLQWAQSMGGTSDDEGLGVATDVTGNVYVTGYFSGVASLGSGINTVTLTSAGQNDAFVARYDTGGTLQWAERMGGSSWDFGQEVAADANGNVYVTGTFNGTATFGSGTNLTSAGSVDVFLAKYDTGGTLQWVQSMGGTGWEEGFGLATDANGNVYVTGSFANFFGTTAFFGSGTDTATLTSAGGAEGFVAKYDTGGTLQWAISMGGTGNDEGRGLATDANGSLYVTGRFNSPTASFGSGTNNVLTLAGNYDAFVAKYDTGGTFQWVQSIAGTGWELGHRVVTDASGNVYVTGWIGLLGPTVFFSSATNTATVISADGEDAFVAKYDAGGTLRWVQSVSGANTERGQGIAMDANGSVYVTGSFDGVSTFGSGTNTATFTSTPVGLADAFLMKLSCNDTSSSYLVVAECADNYTLNGEIYTTSGTYEQHFYNTAGCDSTVVLDLTFYEIEMPVITIDTLVLGVIGTYSTYQWIKNGVDIPGATDSTYTVTENADYQVRVTNEGGCEGTSDIYEVNNVSVNEVSGSNAQISIYPNPADDFIHIQSPPAINVMLTAVDGCVLYKEKNAKLVPVKQLAQGIYLLQITNSEGALLRVEKIVKQ